MTGGQQMFRRLPAMALLCAAVLLGCMQPQPAEAQSSVPTADDVHRAFETLLLASDKGDRNAFARLSQLYPGLYEQALYEASASLPKTAAAMISELDHWLLDRANGGSPTAQFWMGERAKVLQRYGAPLQDIAVVAKWYRAAAEQGFGPAQDSLGQILGFFPEFAEAPFEAEDWLYRAAMQGEHGAGSRLVQAIEIDRQRAGYRPAPEIMAWLQERAAAGDGQAAAVIEDLKIPQP